MKEQDIFAALDALGKDINDHNWPAARAQWDLLLNLYSPLSEMQPELSRVLRRNAEMVHLAERQSTQIH